MAPSSQELEPPANPGRFSLRPETLFSARGMSLLQSGQIIFALREPRDQSPQVIDIFKELAKYFTQVWAYGNSITSIRNDLAHLNMLQGANPAPRLTHWINKTRELMAYDRKLKNAVSKSIIELLTREGVNLRWEIKVEDRTHDLANAALSSRRAVHLGGKRLALIDAGQRPGWVLLEERLLGAGCVAMIAAAFDGEMRPTTSLAEDLSKVDWKSSAERKGSRENLHRTGFKRPSSYRSDRRHGQANT